MPIDEYRTMNLPNWEDRTQVGLGSTMYDPTAFIADPTRVSRIVTYDVDRLRPHLGAGGVSGRRLLHLQCHIGLDTLSWARLGAEVTGLDFSPSAVAAARNISTASGTPGRFVEAELYDAPRVLPEQFDIIYTGVGALGWLPDIAGWARVVAALLAPGGLVYVREAHPLLWALDDERDDEELVLRYPYFETDQPLQFQETTTYSAGDTPVSHATIYAWNHGIAETVQGVIDAGLVLTSLHEHQETEWQALPQLVQTPAGRWTLPADRGGLVPRCTPSRR
jgi:SAM-dependent methyltransferase